MNNQAISPTSDENLLAAISHFFGLLAAFIVWVTQKDKSRFVRFQSIQAMAFDVSVSIMMFVFAGLLMAFVFIVLAVGVGDVAIFGSQANPTVEPVRTVEALLVAVPFLFPCILIPIALVFFVFRLIATIQTFQGKDYHYPWLGALVERSMGH